MLPQSSSPTRPGPLLAALRRDEKQSLRSSSTVTLRPPHSKSKYAGFLGLFGSSNSQRALLPNESIIASLLCFEDSHSTIELMLKQIRDPSDESVALCSLAALLEHHNIAAATLSKILKSDLTSSKDGVHMCLRGDGAAVGLLSRYLSHVCVRFLDKALRKVVTRICERSTPLEPAEIVEPSTTSWISFLADTNSPEAVANAIRSTASPEKHRRRQSSKRENEAPKASSSAQSAHTVGPNPSDQLDVHQLTNLFLECLQQAVEYLPSPVQSILKAIEEACHHAPRKGPPRGRDSHKLLAVASTVFLRFLTPGLVDPTLYALVPTMAKERSNKSLVVFAKHIQSMIGRTMDVDPSAYTREQKLLASICNDMLSKSLTRWKPIQLSSHQYQQHSRHVVHYLRRNKESLASGPGRLRTIIQNLIEQDDFDSLSERSVDDDDSSTGSALSSDSPSFVRGSSLFSRDAAGAPHSGTASSPDLIGLPTPRDTSAPSTAAADGTQCDEPLSLQTSSASVTATRTPSSLSSLSSQWSNSNEALQISPKYLVSISPHGAPHNQNSPALSSASSQGVASTTSIKALGPAPIRKSNSRPLAEHGRALSEGNLTYFSNTVQHY